MTRATATIDTGSRNSYPCHQPIRGQDGGPWTNQRPPNSFPWPGPDHSRASHHWFILIPGDRKPWQYFIPLTLSLFATVLRFGGCCVSVDPSNGLYNTQQWGDHCDLWAHNAAISIVPSKKRDFFSDIKIPVKIRNRCEAILGDLLHLTTTLLSVSQYCDYV